MLRWPAFVIGALLLPTATWSASAETVPTPQPAPKAQNRPATAFPSPPASSATLLPAPPKTLRGQATAQNQLPVPVGPGARSAAAAPSGRPGVFDPKQRALIERINGYLTSVQTLVGDFVQVGPDGRRTDGKFYLQKPGRMRFEYNAPSPLELIADGKSVAIRDRKLATQDLLLLSQTPLRFLLSDRIDLLKEGNLINISSDDTFVTIAFEEKQTIGGTHRLMLMFGTQDLQLKQWTVTDPQGYDTTVALYNTDTGKKPDPGLFTINYERFRD
jgi:outer membrane lipoprotein-sorting protein